MSLDLVRRAARLFRIDDFPRKTFSDGSPVTRAVLAEAIPRAVAATNATGAPLQLRHQRQNVVNLGGLVPGSLAMRGDEVWGEVDVLAPVWQQIKDDPARKRVSVRLELDGPTGPRFSEVSLEPDAAVSGATLFSAGDSGDGHDERSIVFEEGEIMDPELMRLMGEHFQSLGWTPPAASPPEPEATEPAQAEQQFSRGDAPRGLRALFARREEPAEQAVTFSREQLEQAMTEAVRQATAPLQQQLTAERTAREAQFGALQGTRIADRIEAEIRRGVPPEEARLYVPFAEGRAEVTFGEGDEAQTVTVRELAERMLETRRGAVPQRALFAVNDRNSDQSLEKRILAAAAEHEKAGVKPGEALDRAMREVS